MAIFLQLLFTGIGIGAVYSLVALGFVLIYRATNVVNFAQGEFAMLGAYLMVIMTQDLGLPYWAAIPISLAAMGLIGALFNLGVYYPLRHRSFLPVVISTIGASILLTNSVLVGYGPAPESLSFLPSTYRRFPLPRSPRAPTPIPLSLLLRGLSPRALRKALFCPPRMWSTQD